MPSSFKRGAENAPSRYRTPSPPKYAFEPITPVLTGIAADELRRTDTTAPCNAGLKRPYLLYEHSDVDVREQDYLLGGPMDAFASIALATKSSGGRHQQSTSNGTQLINNGYDTADRPSKRTKSENTPLLRNIGVANTGPATSYEQSPGSRRLEAELLLNFAHEAAKLAHSPQEPLQFDTQSSLYAFQPSPNILLEPILPTPEERAIGFIEGKAFSIANIVDQAEARMPSHGGRAFDEKRPASETDFQQETYLPQRISDDAASKILNAELDQDTTETKHLSPTAITQPSDLEFAAKIPKQDADIMRIEAIDRPKAESHAKIPSDAAAHEPQNNAEVEGQNNYSVTNVNDVSHNDISPEQPYETYDPVPKDLTQPMEDFMQSSEEAFQASEAQEGAIAVRIGDSEFVDALEESKEELLGNESRTAHGTRVGAVGEKFVAEVDNIRGSTPQVNAIPISNSDISIAEGHPRSAAATAAVCASCNFSRNSPAIENENDATSWISCDGCKSWFHFACAGFKTDREVRSVDKYRCRKCKPLYGATTYVRKSSRAHSAIDYAGLHQGVIKTSDERPEHHYIKPIKDGTITFLPENFARMRPELVTSEYFEKGMGMREPIVIPVCFNPRPGTSEKADSTATSQLNEVLSTCPLDNNSITENWSSRRTEPEVVIDQGQDALDMVIPQGLTVRQVAELYGQDEKVEVIDVKSQNGENKKWNMRRWVDYYENPNDKVVRNVISLEVSQSKLGRLIRRPQIVRDLDLQDSVWPEELLAKGEYPRVQFYCLMSVADCFTDFHIDFGGSSVFYHILKGKKTFLFIPPKEKHLKKYEEWCMSPAQNWTFLGDQTKECYRVDLSEGDTMLIPAGWIHAVWTPEDSLVIGGNFLTRLNFGMQLRVAQVEKATGVGRRFRYPHFQKLHWYTALRYLEDDPLPKTVAELLHAGGSFVRQQPAHNDFDSWGENSRPGVENYHTRYYSQAELDGLPELTRYLLRTALIDIGSITDGISAETRNAVRKSIPRGHGEPLDVLKTFAAWCAWKRGNEPIPHWAYPDAEPETLAPDKLSAAAMKKLDREAALQAPRRQSARMQSQQAASEVLPNSVGDTASTFTHDQHSVRHTSTPKKSRTSSGGTNGTSHRKIACEFCRKRRRACRHKDQVPLSMPCPTTDIGGSLSIDLDKVLQNPTSYFSQSLSDGQHSTVPSISNSRTSESSDSNLALIPDPSSTAHVNNEFYYKPDDLVSQPKLSVTVSEPSKIEGSMPALITTAHDSVSGNAMLVRPRHKACHECRKSKRRCIHDEYGNEDPVKIRESAIPRPHARKSNPQLKEASTLKKRAQGAVRKCDADKQQTVSIVSASKEQMRRPAPIANMIARPASPAIQKSGVSSLLDGCPQASSAEPFALDPALFEESANRNLHEEQTLAAVPPRQSVGPSAVLHYRYRRELLDSVADQWQTTNPCAAPEIEIGTATLGSSESFEPPASSLVSPPASSHDDGGLSPVNAHARWKSSTDSTASSRHSSTQPKQMQRCTPESGSMRRASSSSYGENLHEQPASPVIADSSSDQKPKTRADSDNKTDEDSMRLIKELQAEEHGLRRRG